MVINKIGVDIGNMEYIDSYDFRLIAIEYVQEHVENKYKELL